MPANFTPQELFDNAACYECFTKGGNATLLTLGLLREIALGVNPSADVSPETLMANASCYNCYIQQYPLLVLALLDQIATNTA